MKETISVIIPVYNVDKYLSECLDSVINQSYKDLQIIVVDDGSTDSCGRICDEYALKDSRITVVHQDNQGAGAAKNTGLRLAKGEYLAFVDSDDYLEPDAFEYMFKLLIQKNADIVQCSYRDLYVDNSVDKIKNSSDIGGYTAEEYLTRYTTDWTCGLLWDKLYRKNLFNGIYFEEGHVIDDEFFTYQGVMNAKKIVIDSKIVYNYRKRKSSVSYIPEHMERIIFDKLDFLISRKDNISDRFPKLRSAFDVHYANMLVWFSTDPYITNRSINEIKERMKQFLKNGKKQGVSFRVTMKMLSIILKKNDKILKNKRNSDAGTNMYAFFS